MQFLKALFWIVATVMLVLIARANWIDVTISLWGDLRVDIKLPLLAAVIFILGTLPVYIAMRMRIWGLKRRIAVLEARQFVERGQPALEPESEGAE